MPDNDVFNSSDVIDLLPLDKKTNELAQEIINESSLNKVQDLTHLFNLNQAKKNVIRVMKLNGLLDKVSDQMIERFEKRPGEFSNTDLINYMQVTQNAIDRAQKQLNLVDESPAISLTQVNVNVEESKLDRDSKAKITEAVSKILQAAQKMNLNLDGNDNMIPAEFVKEADAVIVDENNVEDIDQDNAPVSSTQLLNDEEE